MGISNAQRRDSDGIWVPKPLDGGWGWVVIFGSFLANFVWGGLVLGYGILYKEFLVYFGESRGYTSLIGSVFNGLGYGAGIFASGLMNRYGIRPVAIVGGAIGGVCCALCIFANSILMLIILFGFGVGIGHALNYTAAYIIVPYYFEKRRGMATGLAIAGSGFGNIACAPLIRYLLTEFTWRGFVVIQGGLILQCCIAGALFRPVPLVRLGSDTEQSILSESDAMIKDKDQDQEDEPELTGNGSVVIDQSNDKQAVNRNRIHSDVTEYSYNRQKHANILPVIPESGIASKERRRLYSHQLGEENRTFSLDGPKLAQHGHHRRQSVSGPFLRNDIYFTNSLQQLDEYRSNPDVYWQRSMSISKPLSENAPEPEPDDQSEIQPKSWISGICSDLNDIVGLYLLKRAEFLTFALAIFFLYVGYYVPYTVLYDFVLERGFSPEWGVLLISIMGVANTLGRIVLGSVADLRCVNRIVFFAFVMFLMGSSCCFCYFYTNVYVMAIYAAVFALCVGASKAMTVITTVDLVGLENLTNAYGLLLVFQGLGFFVGNPLAGWLHDLTKSYILPITIIGGILILSGVLILIAPRMKKRVHTTPMMGKRSP